MTKEIKGGRKLTPKPLRRKQFKAERLPWRENITLCVAAECERYKRPFNAIVFACDLKIEGEVATADIGRKLIAMGDESYPILLAETQTRAIALAFEIAKSLHEFNAANNKEDAMNIPPPWEHLLQIAVMRQKNNLAQEIISSRFGISYNEFLETGKEKFPEDLYRETMHEISRTPLNSDLLVLSFSHTQTRIYKLDTTGVVETCDHFAAIGSGFYMAEASLYQRSQNIANDLGTTIYNVYEAMRIGSIAPGVSDKFRIGVAEWDWFEQPNPYNNGEVKISFLRDEYYDYLAKHFARFGPKPVTKVKLKPRLIKEQWRALVLTPAGEADPNQQAMMKRAKTARERESRKRAAKEAKDQAGGQK